MTTHPQKPIVRESAGATLDRDRRSKGEPDERRARVRPVERATLGLPFAPGSAAAHSAFRSRTKFGSLDGLRCLSVVAVVYYHAGPQIEALPFTRKGNLGVLLFFAISGFLITTLLLREKRKFGTISLRKFYARRSLRIFPLYYAVLVAYLVMVLLFEPGSVSGRRFLEHLPYFATYTSNWFVRLDDSRVIFYFAWSLATEEQFYLAWPPLLVLLGVRRGAIFMCLLLSFVVLLPTGLLDGALARGTLARTVANSIMAPIVMGVLLAYTLDHPRGFRLLAGALGGRAAAPFALLLLLAAVGYLPLRVVPATMTLLVAACVVREDNGLAGVLGWPPVVRIGAVSYGVYLLHMLAANLVHALLARVGLNDQRLLGFALTLTLAVSLATLSYRHFEVRFLAQKWRFART